jgi:hypothetical protein
MRTVRKSKLGADDCLSFQVWLCPRSGQVQYNLVHRHRGLSGKTNVPYQLLGKGF